MLSTEYSILEFAKLTSFQLETLPKERTVFFFSVGPMEDHGPHLPMGLDLAEADFFRMHAARRLTETMPDWKAVLMPALPLGIDSNTTKIAVTVRPYVLRDWLVDSCRSLIRLGFLHFVCFSGHRGPKQLSAIEEAGELVRQTDRWKRRGKTLFSAMISGAPGLAMKPSLISASSLLISGTEVLASPFWPDPQEHGGARDTSVALAISADLVDTGYQALPALPRLNSRWSRNWKRRLGEMQGYWGNPSSGIASEGEREVEEALDLIFPKMRAVWEGANPRRLFKSWYSYLLPNRSVFKAWVLAFAFLILMSLWCILNWLSFQVD